MKNIIYLIIASTLLIACSGKSKQTVEDIISSGDIESIRAKRSEIEKEKTAINESLKQLDEAIDKLDHSKRLPLVTTLKVTQQKFEHYLELQGSVQTKQNIVLNPETSGILQKIYVMQGQFVKKGTLLAQIDDGGLAQQLAQLQIQADLAKTTFERQQRLWDQKIGSEMQFLQAKSNYEAQERALEQLKIQLDKSFIRAPFDGFVDDIITEEGSVVAPGQSQIIRIVNLSNMYIEVDVPESYISSIEKGKKVKIHLPILNKNIDSKVRQASNYINPANRTFKIEIPVPNKEKDVKPNLTARIKINDYTNDQAVLVPQRLISENANGEQYVYLIKDKNDKNEAITTKAIIKTGKTQGDVIEVLKGLNSGDEIIKDGARSVREGQAIKIINTK